MPKNIDKITPNDELLIEKIRGKIKEEGYDIVKIETMNYGLTVKLVVVVADKHKKLFYFPIREVSYDTNNKGERTRTYRTIQIEESNWWKDKVMADNA